MNQNLNLKKKKKEIKNEKKNIKKISIFDVMPEKKQKMKKLIIKLNNQSHKLNLKKQHL